MSSTVEAGGWRNRWKTTLAEYGRLALVVYLAIFAVVFAAAAVAIQLGFSLDGAAGGAGTLGAAWVATKVTQPLRIIATVALTPVVAAVRTRFVKKPLDAGGA